VNVTNNAGAGTIILGCLGIIALFVALTGFLAWVFMLAWNAFCVPVFGWPPIDFWTAFAGWVLLGFIGSAFRSVFSVPRS
jgi:hypothetical protein